MPILRLALREPTRLPPFREAHRVESDFRVPVLRGHVTSEPEALLPKLLEPFHHVEVVIGHTEPDATRVERAVAHEVTNELGQLGRHAPRSAGMVLARPVRLRQRRKTDLLRLTDELIERQRHPVPGPQISEPSPFPSPGLVDHLHAMLRGSPDPIPPARPD